MDLSTLPKPDGSLWVYALELIGGRYYIGVTTWPKRRMDQHLKGQAAKFTKLYKPLKILACYPGNTKEEKQLTLEYKDCYGWNNVRGSYWTV